MINITDQYYLFELGEPLILNKPIIGLPKDSFMASMLLTTLSNLEKTTNFLTLKQIYQSALVKP